MLLLSLQLIEEAFAFGLAVFADGGFELAEQLLLLARELGRRLDDDGDELVAARLVADVGDTLAAQAEGGAGLRALGDLVADLAVERRDLDGRAERGLREGDGHLAHDIRAVTREDRVLAHRDRHEQIAVRAAVRAGVALVAHAEGLAVVDAGRDLDLDGLGVTDLALAAAGGAGVGDDGAGIDTEAVKQKAIERGLVSEEDAENLTKKDIIDFLFMPSFSMSKVVTDISGRGVGLDVVKSNIEALGGDVEVKSELGKGSTFTIRLPLTLAIIQALMVQVRDETYAIALASIMNIENIAVSDIKYVQAKEVIYLRGLVIPLVHLDEVLDCKPREDKPDNLIVVIVKKGENYAGLVVDSLIGQQEIVIKSLGKVMDNNKMISGATILGDGDVAMILDSNAMF